MMQLMVLMIVFGTPVAIVALVLHYRLMKLRLSQGMHVVEASDVQDSNLNLDSKAQQMLHRIINLEEILRCEGDRDVIG